jgi:hypothetical protein
MVLNVLSDTETEDGTTVMSETYDLSERRDVLVPPPNVLPDETWETVDEAGEGTGILIVPPENGLIADPGADAPPPGQNQQSIALDLSFFPDSVDSEIGSVQGSVIIAEDHVPPEPRDDEDQAPAEPRDDVALRLCRLLVIRRSYIPLAASLLVLLPLLVSNAMIWVDRSNLRIENLQLKRELLEASMRSSGSHPKNVGKGGSPPPVCACGDKPEEATTLVDNCWVHAKANVQMGRCAEDAKKVVQQKLSAIHGVIRDVADDWLQRKDDDLDPPKDTAPGAYFPGLAKVLMSGAAFVALTALADGALGHFFDYSTEQPTEEHEGRQDSN